MPMPARNLPRNDHGTATNLQLPKRCEKAGEMLPKDDHKPTMQLPKAEEMLPLALARSGQMLPRDGHKPARNRPCNH